MISAIFGCVFFGTGFSHNLLCFYFLPPPFYFGYFFLLMGAGMMLKPNMRTFNLPVGFGSMRLYSIFLTVYGHPGHFSRFIRIDGRLYFIDGNLAVLLMYLMDMGNSFDEYIKLFFRNYIRQLGLTEGMSRHLLVNQNIFSSVRFGQLVNASGFYVQLVPITVVQTNAMVILGLYFMHLISPLLDNLPTNRLGSKYLIMDRIMQCFYLLSLFDTQFSTNNNLMRYLLDHFKSTCPLIIAVAWVDSRYASFTKLAKLNSIIVIKPHRAMHRMKYLVVFLGAAWTFGNMVKDIGARIDWIEFS